MHARIPCRTVTYTRDNFGLMRESVTQDPNARVSRAMRDTWQVCVCAKFKIWMTIVEWVECMGVASGCG